MCDNFDIAVMISGVNYHIATVGVNEAKKEIFYSPKIMTNDLGCDLNFDRMAGTFDHFSFHEDGKIHLKFKAIQRAKEKIDKLPLYYPIGEFPGGIIPSVSNKVRHLIIDSIYQVNNKWFLNTSDQEKTVCRLNQINQFSLLMVLMHRSIDALKFLELEEARKIQIVEKYYEMPIFGEWKIVAYITWQTMPRVLPESLSIYGLSFRPGKEEQFSRHIVAPPTFSAYEYLSMGRSFILPSEINNNLAT